MTWWQRHSELLQILHVDQKNKVLPKHTFTDAVGRFKKRPFGSAMLELGTTHHALISVRQGTDHCGSVALFGLLLFANARLVLLQFLLVQGELNGISGRLRPQVVHACFQALQRKKKTKTRNKKMPGIRAEEGFLSLYVLTDLPTSIHRSACWSVCRSLAQQCGCWETGSDRCKHRGLLPSWGWSFERFPTLFYTAPLAHRGSQQ